MDPGLSRVGCRRVVVCVAEKDMFKDRGWRYGELLGGWGAKAEVVESKGEDHERCQEVSRGERTTLKHTLKAHTEVHWGHKARILKRPPSLNELNDQLAYGRKIKNA
ncbi:hypothetical protein RJ639_002182 [Escallonia herrerae]|uniref:Alpha/beta hydrolase fold-3 domain-containing protein n=1 Tax=Escallonia herrerae TaxID=1293975 RepID=A0AA88XNH2_9ASTE|nr:hypothetical protein RJ639_002182 [Escallonia herrerae]